MEIPLFNVSEGVHIIVVYANNSEGYMGVSEAVNFTVTFPTPSPMPTPTFSLNPITEPSPLVADSQSTASPEIGSEHRRLLKL